MCCFTHPVHFLFMSCFLVLTLYSLKMNPLLQCAWKRRSHTATASTVLPRGTEGALSFASCWPLYNTHAFTHPPNTLTDFLDVFFSLWSNSNRKRCTFLFHYVRSITLDVYVRMSRQDWPVNYQILINKKKDKAIYRNTPGFCELAKTCVRVSRAI